MTELFHRLVKDKPISIIDVITSGSAMTELFHRLVKDKPISIIDGAVIDVRGRYDYD